MQDGGEIVALFRLGQAQPDQSRTLAYFQFR
jgi:hypothetical protein